MQSILNKRTLIKRDIEILKRVSNRPVVFGALTYETISDNEETMRKKAQRFLEKMMPIYEIVEEHGEEHGRYHVHYLGVLKDNVTYLEFHSAWENGYSYIEKCKNSKGDTKRVSKYLCDYIVKQVPKIRRNRRFSACVKLVQEIDKCKSTIDKKQKEIEIAKLFIDESGDLPF